MIKRLSALLDYRGLRKYWLASQIGLLTIMGSACIVAPVARLLHAPTFIADICASSTAIAVSSFAMREGDEETLARYRSLLLKFVCVIVIVMMALLREAARIHSWISG